MGCAGKDGEVERMMERITFDGNFCDISQCRELPCQYGGNCSQKQVWERLKAYEDTGLSPAGLEHAAEIEEGLNKSGYSMERLAELMKADKEGCVVVLPGIVYCEKYGYEMVTCDKTYGICVRCYHTKKEAERMLQTVRRDENG